MMLLNKLKTAGIATLVAFALTGGVGFGLLRAQAGDEPKATQASPRRLPGESETKALEPVNDREFLRRLTLDLTGVLPSRIEMDYFTTDADAKKRAKVINWLIADEGVKATLAKKLNVYVPVDGGVKVRVDVVQALDHSGAVKLNIRLDPTIRLWDVEGVEVRAVTQGKLILNETYLDLPIHGSGVADFDGEGLLDLFLVQPSTRKYIVTDPNPNPKQPAQNGGWYFQSTAVWDYDAVESDAAFLQRAIQAARGTAPTALEQKYFTEDKDPKKREKLLDLLLKDPAVAKKLGDRWKKTMLMWK